MHYVSYDPDHNTTHYIFIGKKEVVWTTSFSGYFEEEEEEEKYE